MGQDKDVCSRKLRGGEGTLRIPRQQEIPLHQGVRGLLVAGTGRIFGLKFARALERATPALAVPLVEKDTNGFALHNVHSSLRTECTRRSVLCQSLRKSG